MATTQKKKPEAAPEPLAETPSAKPVAVREAKTDEIEPPKSYVQIDAEDYKEFLWWKASEQVIIALRDRRENEATAPWPQYWEEMPEAEKPFFAEIMFRFSEGVLHLYIKSSGADKEAFLRGYAGLLLMDFYENRDTGE